MATNQPSTATVNRLMKSVEMFQAASPMTQTLILAELLGTAAQFVSAGEGITLDRAMGKVLDTMDAKSVPSTGRVQ